MVSRMDSVLITVQQIVEHFHVSAGACRAWIEKKMLSAVEVLSVILERVRRIESDSKAVASVLEKMIAKNRLGT
jgi:hypothetical protein